MREHSSHLHLQPLGLYLVRSEICQKTDTSSDYPMTFPAWWRSTSLPAQLHPWKEDSQRQPSVGEIDALCLLWNCLLPDLPLRCFPVWNVLQFAAVWVCSDCISHELVCQPVMINACDFMVILTGFESWSCTCYQDGLCYLAFLSLSLPVCKMNIRMPIC